MGMEPKAIHTRDSKHIYKPCFTPDGYNSSSGEKKILRFNHRARLVSLATGEIR